MNTTKLEGPVSSTGTDEDSSLVGVALIITPPFECTLPLVSIFCAALDAGVRARGVEPCFGGGLWGPWFVVWTTRAADRNACLRTIQEALRALGLWDLCEVGFYDSAEGYWRPVHPHDAAPFDRFLTPENFRWARENFDREMQKLGQDLEWAKGFLTAVQGSVR